MELYKDKYVTRNYFKEKSLLEEIWTAETENITDEEFKKLQLMLSDIFVKYKPENFYFDTLKFDYYITPTMQKWINVNVGQKAFESGIKRVARVMSSGYKTNIPVEEFMREMKTEVEGIENYYFDTEAEARNWLNL